MEIRRLREDDDFFAVSRVYEESWKAAYRDLLPQAYLDDLPAGSWIPRLQQPSRHSLILLGENTIVGVASCAASRTQDLSGWGEIISIYLLPEYWGIGWGKQLFTAAVGELKSMGFQNLFLWVLEGNARAQTFYRHMGFLPSGICRDDTIGGMQVREVQHRRMTSEAPNPSAVKEVMS